jgi:hypothetical protein
MRVHIDGELVVECSHILPDRWNGWVSPVFTIDQMEIVKAKCVELGWNPEGSDDPYVEGSDWVDLGYGEWMTSGWVWQVEGE